jgi:hypothetical protein
LAIPYNINIYVSAPGASLAQLLSSLLLSVLLSLCLSVSAACVSYFDTSHSHISRYEK